MLTFPEKTIQVKGICLPMACASITGKANADDYIRLLGYDKPPGKRPYIWMEALLAEGWEFIAHKEKVFRDLLCRIPQKSLFFDNGCLVRNYARRYGAGVAILSMGTNRLHAVALKGSQIFDTACATWLLDISHSPHQNKHVQYSLRPPE